MNGTPPVVIGTTRALLLLMLLEMGAVPASAAFEALPIRSATVWHYTDAGWTSFALSPAECQALQDGTGSLHIESVYWQYSPSGGRNFAPPMIEFQFDATNLRNEAGPITIQADADSWCVSPGLRTMRIESRHFSYGWPWFGGTVYSWDPATSPSIEITTDCRWAGLQYEDYIGLRLYGIGNTGGGGGLPAGLYSTMDVQQFRVLGDLTPEPMSLLLMSLGGVVLLRRRRIPDLVGVKAVRCI